MGRLMDGKPLRLSSWPVRQRLMVVAVVALPTLGLFIAAGLLDPNHNTQLATGSHAYSRQRDLSDWLFLAGIAYAPVALIASVVTIRVKSH